MIKGMKKRNAVMFEGWQDMPTPWLIHLAENLLLVVILSRQFSQTKKLRFQEQRPHGLRHTPSPSGVQA